MVPEPVIPRAPVGQMIAPPGIGARDRRDRMGLRSVGARMARPRRVSGLSCRVAWLRKAFCPAAPPSPPYRGNAVWGGCRRRAGWRAADSRPYGRCGLRTALVGANAHIGPHPPQAGQIPAGAWAAPPGIGARDRRVCAMRSRLEGGYARRLYGEDALPPVWCKRSGSAGPAGAKRRILALRERFSAAGVAVFLPGW